MFDAVADKLAAVFGVDAKNQLIDSVHIMVCGSLIMLRYKL
jgi:hypothetical protein